MISPSTSKDTVPSEDLETGSSKETASSQPPVALLSEKDINFIAELMLKKVKERSDVSDGKGD